MFCWLQLEEERSEGVNVSNISSHQMRPVMLEAWKSAKGTLVGPRLTAPCHLMGCSASCQSSPLTRCRALDFDLV